MERTRALEVAGYRVIEKWECKDQRTRHVLSVTVTCTYPQAFFYDFGSYRDKMQRNKVMVPLTYENALCRFWWALATRMNKSPRISGMQKQKS